MDSRKMMMAAELERQEDMSEVPYETLSFPKLSSLRQWWEELELPDQFLRACTLREGTWTVVLFLNAVALSLMGYLAACVCLWKEDIDEWWKERFRDDFDFYYQFENQELIASLWPLWHPLTNAIIGVKAAYVASGMLVIYELVKKKVHPFCYMPWLIITGFLVSVMWFIVTSMVIMIFVLLGYRPLTVTWDIAPIACVITYSVAWTYAWFVVIAQYKRRCIVKYWRDRGVVVNVTGDEGSLGDGSTGSTLEQQGY